MKNCHKIASWNNEEGLAGLSRFLQFRSVFFLRSLSVWSCSFRKLHSHHHKIFYRQEQTQASALAPTLKKLHFTAKKAPTLRSVAWHSQKVKPEMKDFFLTNVKTEILHKVENEINSVVCLPLTSGLAQAGFTSRDPFRAKRKFNTFALLLSEMPNCPKPLGRCRQ
jgi:hypothetical protein